MVCPFCMQSCIHLLFVLWLWGCVLLVCCLCFRGDSLLGGSVNCILCWLECRRGRRNLWLQGFCEEENIWIVGGYEGNDVGV